MNNEQLGRALILLGLAFLDPTTPLEQLQKMAMKIGLKIKMTIEDEDDNNF